MSNSDRSRDRISEAAEIATRLAIYAALVWMFVSTWRWLGKSRIGRGVRVLVVLAGFGFTAYAFSRPSGDERTSERAASFDEVEVRRAIPVTSANSQSQTNHILIPVRRAIAVAPTADPSPKEIRRALPVSP